MPDQPAPSAKPAARPAAAGESSPASPSAAGAPTDQTRPPSKWPDWFPSWAAQLAGLYFSRTTAAFVLHGNTDDLVRLEAAGEARRRHATACSASSCGAVVRPLVARPALRPRPRPARVCRARRAAPQGDGRRSSTARLATCPRSPRIRRRPLRCSTSWCAATSWRLEADRLSVAVIVDSASYFSGRRAGHLNQQAAANLVTPRAMSPHVKQLNMAFVLVDDRLSDINDRVTGNPHVAAIEVPARRSGT